MKKPRKKALRKRRVQYNFVYNKDRWIKGSAQIKKYRDSLLKGMDKTACMASGLPFSNEGLQGPTLDHEHATGLCRGCCRADVNLFIGRVELYHRKLLGKTGLSLLEVLEGIIKYLKNAEELAKNPNCMLDFRTVDAEVKRISRWKTSTIYNKLDKSLELLPEDEYNQGQAIDLHTRQQVIEMYINQFIKRLED